MADLLAMQRKVFESSLSTPAKITALALLDHWSRKTETFPSVSRLARMTSQCARTVKAAIRGLEAAGAIQVKRNQGLPNRYTFVGVMALHEGTHAKPPKGNRGNRCTGAGDALVQEIHPTGAGDAP